MALTKISRGLLSTGVSDSSDATAITIDSSERVMIGTTDAGYPDYGDSLTVADVDGGGGNAGMTIRSGTSSYGTFYFSDATGTAAGTYAGKMQYNHSNNSMVFGTNSADRLIIDSSGNVGIGVTTPSTLLHQKKDSSGAYVTHLIDNANSGGYANTTYRCGSAESGINYAPGIFFAIGPHTNDTTTPITFRNNNATERMRITASGHVGLTTDFPSDMTNSSYRQFKVGGAIFADSGGGTGSATFITNNNYVGTGNNMRMDSGGACSGIRMTQGQFHVYTFDGSGGSADAALTQNDRLSIASGGAVSVSGSFSKGSGSFKIDHPLESKKDTHHLVHSFIEGPQADLIYRGTAILENGTASVNLDTAAGMTEGTFILLNGEVQCFTTNESDWDAVKGSVSGNILTITCQDSSSTATVSWLVVGERKDQHMIDTEWTDSQGKVIVEPLKEG